MGTGTRNNLHVLCYQHHLEMPPGELSEPLVYLCQEPGCPIRYNSSTGYFIDPADKDAVEREILPRVVCDLDGRPMYLAEAQTQRRSFRLWKCPQCDASRTDADPPTGLQKKMGA